MVESTACRETHPNCGICWDSFRENQRRWTHEEGHKHSPFHWNCIGTWLETSATCPFDREPINPDAINKPRGAFEKVKQLLIFVAVLTSGTAIGLSSTSTIAHLAGPSGFLFALTTTAIVSITGGGVAGSLIEKIDKVATNHIRNET